MDARLVQLENWGCDVKNALPRMLDDEEFLLDCMGQVADDPAFETLGECLKKKDAAGAFEAAHSLKGITANTGLTPIYNIVVELVEPLRRVEEANLYQVYERLTKKRDEFKAML